MDIASKGRITPNGTAGHTHDVDLLINIGVRMKRPTSATQALLTAASTAADIKAFLQAWIDEQ